MSSHSSRPLLLWQQVPWHQRRSYWELDEAVRQDLCGALEAEAADLARRSDAALDDYAARPGTLAGQLVNGDLLATLLPSLRQNPTQGYEALEDPAGRAAVHLNALGKRLRDRALAHGRGRPVIIFMGGQATGKTTSALALGPVFGAVFDAPHTDPEGGGLPPRPHPGRRLHRGPPRLHGPQPRGRPPGHAGPLRA